MLAQIPISNDICSSIPAGRAAACWSERSRTHSASTFSMGGAWRSEPYQVGKVILDLVGYLRRQRGLADTAHAQHRHQATAVGDQPLLELGRFCLAAIENLDVGRFTPIDVVRRERGRGCGRPHGPAARHPLQ